MAPAFVAIALACVFLVLLLSLHVLKPELDPSWHWISEYEVGRFGWMMRLAFFCWGGAVLALVVELWPSLRPIGGILGGWWLVMIAVALVGAGVFKTNLIADRTVRLGNTLHAIFGAFVILTLPIAATLTAAAVSGSPVWAPGLGWVVLATTLTWVGLAVFLVSDIVAGHRSPTTERVGNLDVRVGWQNRFMVVTYVLWVVFMSAASVRL